MTTQGDMLRNKAIESSKNNPNGLRCFELVMGLQGIFPDVSDCIRNVIWYLNQRCYKISTRNPAGRDQNESVRSCNCFWSVDSLQVVQSQDVSSGV